MKDNPELGCLFLCFKCEVADKISEAAIKPVKEADTFGIAADKLEKLADKLIQPAENVVSNTVKTR